MDLQLEGVVEAALLGLRELGEARAEPWQQVDEVGVPFFLVAPALFVLVEPGEQLAALAFMAVEAFADAAAEFATGFRVAGVFVFVELVKETFFTAFDGLDLLTKLLGFLRVVGAGDGCGSGRLGAEEFGAAGAEDALAEEPVDRVDEDLLAHPQGLGVLVEPVGVAVVNVVAVADVLIRNI